MKPLIGLGMLLLTGWWWPGIMLVIGAASASELFLRGKALSAIGTFALFAGIPLMIDLVNAVDAEGLLIGLLSWLLALPAGALVALVLSVGVGKAFLNRPLPYAYAPGRALVWLGLSLTLATLASLLPAWRAARLTVREVLAYE